MASVKLEDCSQTLELDVNIKDEEEEEKIGKSVSHGLSHLVRTQQVVTATLGENAVLTCELMKPKDVLRHLGEKMTQGQNVNIGSYSKRFGPVVNLPFEGKMEFEDEGLQNCSIVFRGVSRGDESCYRCLTPFQMDLSVEGPASK
ncbi:OX-2 membrane glycoprotein-like isoform X2 [Salvelinus fontinalis]|uniref:OX-2 membrane glycoprotein-like isoform X2 n=1 Tax=Salvelinus fontinalis TaxID=8038 RepID=UPI0024868254|nr:OX-2 membrane glycoprotein-like isoform X2 [Salvelinus fontinalis]